MVVIYAILTVVVLLAILLLSLPDTYVKRNVEVLKPIFLELYEPFAPITCFGFNRHFPIDGEDEPWRRQSECRYCGRKIRYDWGSWEADTHE